MAKMMKPDPLARMKRIADAVNNPPGCAMPLTMVDSTILVTLWTAAQRGDSVPFSDLYAEDQAHKNIVQGAVSKLSYGRLQRGGQRADGLGLIDHIVDENDRRRRVLVLTKEGREVAEALVEALVGEPVKIAAEPARDPGTGRIGAKRAKAA